ncbi:hypothetical protein M2150_001549 [Lachnospiraceae bacterium PM6-15]|uniref:hypothetical protein n=1 Tax=Ohessyouella blattaphilus TaxID=2949333 RepID=UPI003E1F1C67
MSTIKGLGDSPINLLWRLPIKNEFKSFLISEGYSEYTPSGNKSTIYEYMMRVNKIIEWENMTWDNLKINISAIVSQYDVSGSKEELDQKSHNAYINALRAFQRFVKTSK